MYHFNYCWTTKPPTTHHILHISAKRIMCRGPDSYLHSHGRFDGNFSAFHLNRLYEAHIAIFRKTKLRLLNRWSRWSVTLGLGQNMSTNTNIVRVFSRQHSASNVEYWDTHLDNVKPGRWFLDLLGSTCPRKFWDFCLKSKIKSLPSKSSWTHRSWSEAT